jgi:hypothetical protein
MIQVQSSRIVIQRRSVQTPLRIELRERVENAAGAPTLRTERAGVSDVLYFTPADKLEIFAPHGAYDRPRASPLPHCVEFDAVLVIRQRED